jgi:hypothetical protein
MSLVPGGGVLLCYIIIFTCVYYESTMNYNQVETRIDTEV